MSFYIDTEPAGTDEAIATDEAGTADADSASGSAAFYLDTSSSRQQQKKQQQQQEASATSSESKKRKRRRETEAYDSSVNSWSHSHGAGEIPGLDVGSVSKIFYRSVSTGELGQTAASAAASHAASASDASAAVADSPPKNRRPRFSRQALNSRFFDQVAAAASDGAAGNVGGSVSGGVGAGGLDAFRPGELSDRLREALGLKPDELPTHVYRMRELGYPPGWMLEARVMPTGVAIFDDSTAAGSSSDVKVKRQSADGNANNSRRRRSHEPADEPEQPEVEEEEAAAKYDVTKLVKYPGFNCPLPQGVHDRHRSLGFPPMRLDDHLSTFIHFLAGRNQIQATDAYHTRRRRLARQSNLATAAATAVTAAAATADEEEGGKEEPPGDEDDEEDSSLDDLEARRLELLRQLEADPESLEELDSCSSGGGGDENGNGASHGEEETPADESSSSAAAAAAAAAAAVVSTQFGSPVFTTYGAARLPNPDNFHRDIEQFRPYENLPATASGSGGYAKVNEVVKKIRESLPRIA